MTARRVTESLLILWNKDLSDDRKDLTTGSVPLNLYRLSAPMTLGIAAVLSISLVDTYFVSKLGTQPLAALSFTFPVTLTITSLAIGLSAGAASVVSRSIGEKNKERTRRLSTDSLILSFLFVIPASILGYLLIRPLFSFIGASGEVLELIVRYMQIWYISMPFLVIPIVSNGLIRAAGDAFWPSLIMIGSASVNIALTPAFIFGWGFFPELHIEGAAVATLIARIFVFIFALCIIIFREKMVAFIIPPIKEIVSSWLEIIKIAVPAAAGNMFYPVCIGVATSLLSQYGDSSVAAFGAATRIESFACIIMLALSSAIGPFSGQNWGARKYDRIRKALKDSYLVCFVWSIFLFGAFWFLGDIIATQFSSDAETKEEIALYLHIISLTLAGYGISIIAAGCFNAIGHPYIGFVCYLVRCGLLYIPLVYVSTLFYNDVTYVLYAIAAANIISAVVIGYFSINNSIVH